MANKFSELPEKIREWLTSERVTYMIIEMNKKLDLFGNSLSVIPNLITRLATKNLEPKNFIQELENGLGLDNEQAQEISREIVEKILRPVDLPLKETGVFIGLIYGGATSSAIPPRPQSPTPPVPQPPQVPPIPKPPIPPSGAEALAKAPTPPRPTPPLITTKEMAHPEESIQNKVIPIPVKRPQPPQQ